MLEELDDEKLRTDSETDWTGGLVHDGTCDGVSHVSRSPWHGMSGGLRDVHKGLQECGAVGMRQCNCSGEKGTVIDGQTQRLGEISMTMSRVG
jgi:hypothetical protein